MPAENELSLRNKLALLGTFFLCLTSAMTSSFALAADGSEKPLVLIMVDSVRPDVIAEEVANGNLPNIKKHFYEEGTHFDNSFATASLDVPAWSSILSGLDLDRSGIKGNETFDRKTKVIQNYLDWRRDLWTEANRRHGRAYTAIHRAGGSVVFDWFNRGVTMVDGKWAPSDNTPDSETFFTFFPINDAFPDYFNGDVASHLANYNLWDQTSAQNAILKLLFDFDSAQSLDRYGVDKTIQVLSDTSGLKRRLIGVYLAGPGYLTHIEYQRGRRSLIEMDHQIGRLFEALRKTRYKDSVVVLVGDHGFIGGQEGQSDNQQNPLRGESFALTATNLSFYLSGWYNKPGYADYNFDVESPYAAEGKFSLFNLEEIKANPFQCTNVARVEFSQVKSCENYVKSASNKITAAVTTSETISLPYARRESGDWVTSNNWYTLTHYVLGARKDGTPLVKNLIKDLENFTLDNLAVFSSSLAAKIGNKPLDWLALNVSGAELSRSPQVASLGINAEGDVILIHKSSESEALIIPRTEPDDSQTYRYVPIRHFDQAQDGAISFELNPKADPLGYMGNGGNSSNDAEWFANYHGAVDWVARYSKTAFPNTVPSLVKFIGFRGRMEGARERLHADLYLNPNYGHFFAVNNDVHEVNHGMWQKEAVQNLFMITGPGVKKSNAVSAPAFTMDVIPTALRASRQDTHLNVGPLSNLKIDGRILQDALE